jgi:hypothetical protein
VFLEEIKKGCRRRIDDCRKERKESGRRAGFKQFLEKIKISDKT